MPGMDRNRLVFGTATSAVLGTLIFFGLTTEREDNGVFYVHGAIAAGIAGLLLSPPVVIISKRYGPRPPPPIRRLWRGRRTRLGYRDSYRFGIR
jgi:hypothetical protein